MTETAPPLVKQNLGEIARTLSPWLTYQIARFSDLEVNVFVCQGAIALHRHIEQDELFLVYEGNMLLSSDRGDLNLRAEELALVPKGTAHQSSATLPATVIILRVSDDIALRRDGRWQLFSTDQDLPLEKINLGALYSGLQLPYQAVDVLLYEGWSLRLMRGAGMGPPMQASWHGAPLVVMRGMALVVPAEGEPMAIQAGDVVRVPPNMRYHLEADTAAMVFMMEPEF